MDRDLILRRVIDTCGVDHQVDIAIEEMSELTKALLKARRKGKKTSKKVLSEIADVQIMLDQLKIIYGASADMEAKKLERLANRLKSGKKL